MSESIQSENIELLQVVETVPMIDVWVIGEQQ